MLYYLMPLFKFFAVIAIVLVIANFVRPRIPEFLQTIFTGFVLVFCLLITLNMGFSAVFEALKGVFAIAFDS